MKIQPDVLPENFELLAEGSQSIIYNFGTGLLLKVSKNERVSEEKVRAIDSMLCCVGSHFALNSYQGVACISKLQSWGTLYEKVLGDKLSSYLYDNCGSSTIKIQQKLMPILKDVVEALIHLDQKNYPHTDISEHNILVSSINQKPVIIDYETPGPIDKELLEDSRLTSRQKFGEMLQRLIPEQEGINEKLALMIDRCCSNEPLEKYGWRDIQTTIAGLQPLRFQF